MSGSDEALTQEVTVQFPCVVPVKVRRKVNVTGNANGRTDNVEVNASVAANESVLCHRSASKEHTS